MKKLLLLAALLGGGSLFLQDVSVGHGGTYRGPGDTVPPGGGGGGGGGGPTTPGPAGPSNPGPSGPSTPPSSGPGGASGGPGGGGAAPSTGPGTDTGPDLTVWSFWWGFNKDPYLNLKASIHSGAVQTGSDGFFLGQGEQTQSKDSLRPTEEQIRQKVVPALLRALENETNNDIITGALVALAKIGDAKDEGGESRFEKTISEFLSDGNQEIAETAAVALGILANPASLEKLRLLATDDPLGQRLVGSTEVPWRTRAFATYGMGLLGNRVSANDTRRDIATILVELIQSPRMSTRDVKVAAIIALGLVPLDLAPEGAATEGAAGDDEKPSAAELATLSRQGQIAFLLDFLKDDDNHYLIRAHVPRALARLLEGATDTEREAVTRALLEGCGRHTKEPQEIRQSCVLALGQIGDTDEDKLDADIREELFRVTADGQNQERYFSLISLAQVAGRPGEGKQDDGLKKIREHLLRQMVRGKSQLKPWAALAVGVMGRAILDADGTPSTEAGTALRTELQKEGNPDYVGAYALATGIRRDVEAKDILLEHLGKFSQDSARGDIAVALGLMGVRESIEPIQQIVTDSKYRPELLKQAAIALGLLGDKDIVPVLIDMLKEAKGLASQAAIASALGFIGDSRSIDDLVAMLENKQLTDRARGFAAVALGIVADKEPLPWNSKISVDINYRANTTTLTSAADGTGILDIL